MGTVMYTKPKTQHYNSKIQINTKQCCMIHPNAQVVVRYNKIYNCTAIVSFIIVACTHTTNLVQGTKLNSGQPQLPLYQYTS